VSKDGKITGKIRDREEATPHEPEEIDPDCRAQMLYQYAIQRDGDKGNSGSRGVEVS